MPDPAYEIGAILRNKGLSLGTVESATGGLISHLITNVPGSSDYFKGAIVAYSNEIKIRLAGVKTTTLEKHGAVSAEVAREMAAGGRQALEVDVCISVTGIAGPTGATPEKPAGLFYIGISTKTATSTHQYLFKGNREENKSRAARVALEWLYELLNY